MLQPMAARAMTSLKPGMDAPSVALEPGEVEAVDASGHAVATPETRVLAAPLDFEGLLRVGGGASSARGQLRLSRGTQLDLRTRFWHGG